jgi:membrane protease subunit (stomatin/prohibitin family)
MPIFGFLSGQFIDVIEWTDDGRGTLVSRFEREGHEIKYGAKLTVREGQAAVFVHEGRIADVFTPGLYKLETNNMPVLTALQHWDHGFRSPFRSEIYFVSTVRIGNLKWGTKTPVIARDPEFGPVRLRAFGTYAIRVADPARFLAEIVGTDGSFTTEEISDQIRDVIVQEVSRALAASGLPVLDMAANTAALSDRVAGEIAPTLAGYGLELAELYVESVSLPQAVAAALDDHTTAGIARRPARAVPESGPASPPPPPPEAETVWHVAEGGEARGPYPRAALGRMAAVGEIGRATWVWTPGQDGWRRAGEVPDLAQLFPPAPPPPPED